MHWEKCKRDTKCIDCKKTMVAGDHRLKVIQYIRGYRSNTFAYPREPWFTKIEYRCRVCGTAYIDDYNNYRKHPISRMPKGFLPRRIEFGEEWDCSLTVRASDCRSER